MNGHEAEDRIWTEIEVAVANEIEAEEPGVPLTEATAVMARAPATVGPCPTCRRIVTRAFGDDPAQKFWFHLSPRGGLCARHYLGAKVS